MTKFFSLVRREQLGNLTNRSKVAGVINDRNAIIIAPFNEIIRSKSGVAEATRTKKHR